MAYKSDIQATRSTAAAGASAIIAQPVRLRGIIVSSDGGGAGSITLQDGNSATQFQGDCPNGDVFAFNIPEDGVVFEGGMTVSAISNIAGATLLIDK